MEQEGNKMTQISGLAAKVASASVTEAVNLMFSMAVEARASDIHLEPIEEGMRVRFRIDGVLQDILTLSKDKQAAFTSRIKFLAKLKLDVKNLPQDGRFSVKIDDTDFDVRVSVLPTLYGESVVMRLLTRGAERLEFAALGFSDSVKERITEAITRPQGMILNTGPTGSGKTTTLYAILDKINRPEVKTITLEDPIEYRLSGVVQSQVNVEEGYDFANGLRSILRQDPDIIMIGEIRDVETARIAVNAAITGHIVLSTLHTTDSASALPRLLDMEVEPFLLSGAVSLVIAQRLVRKICPSCQEKRKISAEVRTLMQAIYQKLPESFKKLFPSGIPEELVYGKGCSQCGGTGFFGRAAIAEALKVTPEIEKLVLQKAPISEIRQKAVEQGLVTMEQDGLMKVLRGETTIEEVWRVTRG